MTVELCSRAYLLGSYPATPAPREKGRSQRSLEAGVTGYAAARGGDASKVGHAVHVDHEDGYDDRQRPAPIAPSHVRGIALSSAAPVAPHMQHRCEAP